MDAAPFRERAGVVWEARAQPSNDPMAFRLGARVRAHAPSAHRGGGRMGPHASSERRIG
ncbi:hypothetical protein HMPREF1316_1232 [Olsenella profusa F0195]|uniref:Uncharacterized protein n=1 Tax=Olsenella profusa F0195 TaxID=1125712 RepID=U2T003_9ACTN|nr:hypothetical protein HMPREF1316_1232 [Olsenella profusa F0195]